MYGDFPGRLTIISSKLPLLFSYQRTLGLSPVAILMFLLTSGCLTSRSSGAWNGLARAYLQFSGPQTRVPDLRCGKSLHVSEWLLASPQFKTIASCGIQGVQGLWAPGALRGLQWECLCWAWGVLHSSSVNSSGLPRWQCCALLFRVTELSALLAQSQKQNEDYEKMVKALRETMEILVCDPVIWEGGGSRLVDSLTFMNR